MNSTISSSDASSHVLDMGKDLDTSNDSANEWLKNGIFYFRVLKERKLSNGSKGESLALSYKDRSNINRYFSVIVLLVKAVKDMSLEYLSREIHARLRISDAEIVMHKILDGIEDEILNYSQPLSSIQFDTLKVTPGHRLRNNETRAHVFLLDLKAITDVRNILGQMPCEHK